MGKKGGKECFSSLFLDVSFSSIWSLLYNRKAACMHYSKSKWVVEGTWLTHKKPVIIHCFYQREEGECMKCSPMSWPCPAPPAHILYIGAQGRTCSASDESGQSEKECILYLYLCSNEHILYHTGEGKHTTEQMRFQNMVLSHTVFKINYVLRHWCFQQW